MKNLRVSGTPAGVHALPSGTQYNVPATVRLEYYEANLDDDLVYATHSYHLRPAQARQLAAELVAAADKADGVTPPAEPAAPETAKAVGP